MDETYRRRSHRVLEGQPKSTLEYKDLPDFGLFIWAHMNAQCMCAFAFMMLMSIAAVLESGSGKGNKVIADATRFVFLLSGCFQGHIAWTMPFWLLKTIAWAANEEMKSRELKLPINLSFAIFFISGFDFLYCFTFSVYVNRIRNGVEPAM